MAVKAFVGRLAPCSKEQTIREVAMAAERVRSESNHLGFGHPGERRAGLVKAVLLAMVLIAGSPVQAAAQTIFDDILARVNAAVSAASGARAAAPTAGKKAVNRKATAKARTKVSGGAPAKKRQPARTRSRA